MTSPAHSITSDGGRGVRRLGPRRLAIVAGVLVALAGLTAGVLALTNTSAPTRSTTGTKGPTSSPKKPASPAAVGSTTTTTAPLVALAVRSVTPKSSATGVHTDSLITVTFSVPLAAWSPAPTLSPKVAGHWVLRGTRWSFHPQAGYIPGTRETLRVPTSTTATEGSRRVHLGAVTTSSFTVGAGSVLRLQQLLAELHYLPFTFTRPAAAGRGSSPAAKTSKATAGKTTSGSAAAGKPVLSAEPTAAAAVSTEPEAGQLSWAYPDIPTDLSGLWAQGKGNEVTRGAVMAFEADHNLAVDGDAGPEVWNTLIKAVAARTVDLRPYNYIEVTESEPETLTVWQDGRTDVYSSPANTGVPGAATALGTYPVYLRYAVHAMIGTDTDGKKYDDPAIPWIAYFNGGDAIHGYPRADYGFPQSNGCVELPIDNAAQVWNSGEDWYGTLVDVS